MREVSNMQIQAEKLPSGHARCYNETVHCSAVQIFSIRTKFRNCIRHLLPSTQESIETNKVTRVVLIALAQVLGNHVSSCVGWSADQHPEDITEVVTSDFFQLNKFEEAQDWLHA